MRAYRANAAYYDHEIERLKWLERDVPFFLKQIGKAPREILELAVGTGRAAIPMAQAGHRVVGVDYAPDMLAVARRKRDAVGLDDERLLLLKWDVTKLRLNQRFDFICIFFNTFLAFTTLARQDRVLQVARNHLKPDGKLWLDIFQPNLTAIAEPESKGVDPYVFYVPRFDRTVYMDADIKRNRAGQLMVVTFNYKWFDKRGVEQREKRTFDMTFMFPRELRILLERNGFRIRRQWGDYDGKRLNADSSRIVTLAEMR